MRDELPDCLYRCANCRRVICMDADPSPGEQHRTCGDCYDTEIQEPPC